MESFWDIRYNTDSFVYGKDPNGFFATSLERLIPGRILLPGEGEGRNAVYAAAMGWEVDAFDQSGVARDKALSLMQEKRVHFNYQVCELVDYNFEKEHYDVIGLVYLHVPPPVRKMLHRYAVEALKPGGRIILEAFHTSQLGNPSGGPQVLDMLFDKKTLLDDFNALHYEIMEEVMVNLEEGPVHKGPANLIRYIGKK